MSSFVASYQDIACNMKAYTGYVGLYEGLRARALKGLVKFDQSGPLWGF